MSNAKHELLLKKHRLLLESRDLRRDFSMHASGLKPACSVADGAVVGALWLRAHPQAVVVVGVAFIVAQPKRAWHWAKRVFSVWQTWNRVKTLLDQRAVI